MLGWGVVAYSAAMTTIYHDHDADLSILDGARVAVVGYGNQGRSWRSTSALGPLGAGVRARRRDAVKQAAADGFTPGDLTDAEHGRRGVRAHSRRCDPVIAHRAPGRRPHDRR